MTIEMWMLLATLGVNATSIAAVIGFRVSLENRLTRIETMLQMSNHTRNKS
jgi:hypothetical protein